MTDDPRSDDQPTIDVANADLLLSTTRSVRKRLDFERPVERETLLECLELAVQAPTGSNRQTWRWMIVTDPGLKKKIADIYREQGMDYLRNGLADSEATGDSSQLRIKDSALYLAENFEQRPRLRHPLHRRGPGGEKRDRLDRDARLDHPGGLELPARAPRPRPRLDLDHAPPR